VDLNSTSSQTPLRCATASVSWRWSPLASPYSQAGTSTTLWDGYGLVRNMPVYSPSFRRVIIPACHRPWIQAGVSRDMPVYFPSFRQVIIPACHRGGLRLHRPRAWFCAEVVYLSKVGHPPRRYQHVTATLNQQRFRDVMYRCFPNWHSYSNSEVHPYENICLSRVF